MVEEKYQPQDTVSYEKYVVEIDTVNYGGNFVKDVCVDEAGLLHQNISVERLGKRSSPKFSRQMIDANSDTIYGKKGDARESIHELKPEVIVPVDIAPESGNDKRYSSGKESDLDCLITSGYIACDPGDKKISLQELLRLESEEESRHAATINSKGSEQQKHPLPEVVGQASINDSHEIQDIAPGSSEHASSGVSIKESTSDCLSMMPKDHEVAAAIDVREPSKIDRHNPCVDHRSLENTLEPECSMPGITGTATTESICSADKTDSSIDMARDSTEVNEVETSGSGVDAASASISDVQSSETITDHNENNASKKITWAVDETAVATSSPNRELQGKRDGDIVPEVHNSNQNQKDEENDIYTGTVRDDSAVEQNAPDSSKETACVGNCNQCEPNLPGPSIMSEPVSTSGHMAYSGNVSLRSDSSTTSTRSFAFPVLQREWISSPVRMAKADCRRGRRRRSWRKGLICCKF